MFVASYLIFQFLISSTLILGYLNLDFPFVLEYFMTVIYAFFFVFYLVYRPYNHLIHNIGLLLNIFTTFSFLVWCSLRKMRLSDKILQQEREITAIYILISLISLCLLIAILRIVQAMKSSTLCKIAEKKIAKKKKNKIVYP